MAVITPTIAMVAPGSTNVVPPANGIPQEPWWLVTWETVTENDTCAAVAINLVGVDIEVHMFGTFGGGVMDIEGSNDGTNFDSILDGAGDTIAVAADGFVPQGLANLPGYLQPVASTAGTSRDIDIKMLIRPHIPNKR